MTYKQLINITRKCEALHDQAAEKRISDPARQPGAYKDVIDQLTEENLHSLALLLANYHFTGAKTLIKGMFA